MATGDNTRLGSLPASVANEARRDPSRSGRPAKSCLRRGPCEGIIAKEHGRTRAGDAQEVRPSTLLNFAHAPAYEETVLASMFDIPAGLDRITCPVLIMQGTADPLISMQSPRFLAFIPGAQFRWLYGLSHVPISDDPELVTGLMLDFLSTAAEGRVLQESLPALA